MGAWIEIRCNPYPYTPLESLPSWERGLKLTSSMLDVLDLVVAPLVGAWIEITKPSVIQMCP